MESLNFLIRFHCPQDIIEVRRWFREEWYDLHIDWSPFGNFGKTKSPINLITLKKNEVSDQAKIETGEGWWYYNYIFEVLLVDDKQATLNFSEYQINLARLILSHLKNKDCKVYLISDEDFSNLVISDS